MRFFIPNKEEDHQDDPVEPTQESPDAKEKSDGKGDGDQTSKEKVAADEEEKKEDKVSEAISFLQESNSEDNASEEGLTQAQMLAEQIMVKAGLGS